MDSAEEKGSRLSILEAAALRICRPVVDLQTESHRGFTMIISLQASL